MCYTIPEDIENRRKKVEILYGYVRVSTREQNEERQLIALSDYGVPRKQGDCGCYVLDTSKSS